MELKDYLTIIAVLLSPFFAVQAEKFIERRRNERDKKLSIFKTLMATRGSKLSMEHVTALNQIDLEFYGNKKFTKVLYAWKDYLDQLFVQYNKEREEEFRVWNDRAETLFTELLFEMGLSLGYSFDRVAIRRNAYSPSGHIKVEYENQQIRELLIKVLRGESAISNFPISPDEVVDNNNKALEKTGELQSLLIEHYKNGAPINVKISKD